MTKRFFIDMIERIVWTFIEAFLALWIVVSGAEGDELFTWQHTRISLVAGVIAAGKAILASRVGRVDSASTAPSV